MEEELEYIEIQAHKVKIMFIHLATEHHPHDMETLGQ